MQPETPRANKGFIHHVDRVMDRLQAAYLQLVPDLPHETLRFLFKEFFLRQADAESWEQQYRNGNHGKSKDLIVLGCVYCAHAAREYHANHPGVAWTYLAEASYYAGAAAYAKSLDEAWPGIMQLTARQAVSNTKAKGGKARNAGWQQIEDEAVRLVKLQGESGRRWPNERDMARSIRPALWPFALTRVSRISELKYVDTVSGRLKLRRADIGMYLNPGQGASC